MKLSQPIVNWVEFLITFFQKELKIPSILNFTHNESNDSFTEALSYFENPLSIVNMKRRVLIEKEFYF